MLKPYYWFPVGLKQASGQSGNPRLLSKTYNLEKSRQQRDLVDLHVPAGNLGYSEKTKRSSMKPPRRAGYSNFIKDRRPQNTLNKP